MAGELILKRKGSQHPLYLGAVGQAVVLEAGLILFIFVFLLFPSHLAAAPYGPSCSVSQMLFL